MIATARCRGSRGDPVIFVHGVGSTAAIWDRQLVDLGDAYRCFAVELRGNGVPKPEASPEQISREGFAEDVLAVADAANADRFHFVGCSLGGAVGLELCRRSRERIATLTLVGAYAAYPSASEYVGGIIAAVRAAGTMRRFALERAEALGLPRGERHDETIEQYACKSPESFIAATRATWLGDYRSELPEIRVPALIVRGSRDSVAGDALARELAGGIPAAELVTMEDAGHVANADHPARFNRILRDFLQRNAMRSAPA